MTKIVLWDETTVGERVVAGELSIAVDGERLTLREVIRRRVSQQAGLVWGDPGPNPGSARDPNPTPDPEARLALAVDAFARNGFVVLVGDRQIEDLDEQLELRSDTEVVFLKLIALAGG